MSVELTANWEVIVNIDIDNALKFIETLEEDIDIPVKDGIFNWLWDFKQIALAEKPWKDRTGALRRAHKIVEIVDGWSLEVDARETSGKDYNYAIALEKGWLSDRYKWLEPVAQDMESELEYYIEKEIKNYIDKIERRYIKSPFEMKTGEQYVMLRHPAGTKDPITGESLGGRFYKKLE